MTNQPWEHPKVRADPVTSGGHRVTGDDGVSGFADQRSRSRVGDCLRLALAGEDTLSISDHPIRALHGGRKSAKFQTCSPTTCSTRAKTSMYVETSCCWNSSLHIWAGQRMQPRNCVGPKLGDHDRLVVVVCPQPEFVFKSALAVMRSPESTYQPK